MEVAFSTRLNNYANVHLICSGMGKAVFNALFLSILIPLWKNVLTVHQAWYMILTKEFVLIVQSISRFMMEQNAQLAWAQLIMILQLDHVLNVLMIEFLTLKHNNASVVRTFISLELVA